MATRKVTPSGRGKSARKTPQPDPVGHQILDLQARLWDAVAILELAEIGLDAGGTLAEIPSLYRAVGFAHRAVFAVASDMGKLPGGTP